MRNPRVPFEVQWLLAAGLIAVSAGSEEALAQAATADGAAKVIEFQFVKDKAPVTFRDMAAYASLLKQTRETKPGELAERARRDLDFQDFWDDPQQHRGALVELRGFCRRIYSSESKLGAGGRLNVVWATLPDSDLPFACIVEKLPEGFPIEAAVAEPVIFRGFFLKLMAYDSGDGRRGAPLFIGSLERVPGEKPADPLDDEQACRLPVAAGAELTVPREPERFLITVDGDGALTLEDKQIDCKEVAGTLARLASQLQLSARALGTLPDASRALPAVIAIEADDQTPCSRILQLMDDCRASGFKRFALKSPRTADRLAEARPAPVARDKENDLPSGLRTIPIVIVADDRGRIAGAEVGENQHRNFDALRGELTSILDDPDLPFDRARIRADGRLIYSELHRVIELLTNLNVTTIELGPIEPLERTSSK
jgi:biopolymer transport protein ExbD